MYIATGGTATAVVLQVAPPIRVTAAVASDRRDESFSRRRRGSPSSETLSLSLSLSQPFTVADAIRRSRAAVFAQVVSEIAVIGSSVDRTPGRPQSLFPLPSPLLFLPPPSILLLSPPFFFLLSEQ